MARATSKTRASTVQPKASRAPAPSFAARLAGLPAPALTSTREHHQEHGASSGRTPASSATSKPKARPAHPRALAVSVRERPASKGRKTAPSPLVALVDGLIALLSAHTPSDHEASGRALLAALHALADRMAEYCALPAHRARLVAHTEGPVVGLRLAPADPKEDSVPLRGADLPLVRLCNDLALVLDHHDEKAGGSDAVRELVCAVWGMLGQARAHLKDPALRLEADTDQRGETTLRLVPPVAPPSEGKPERLSTAHRDLIFSTLEAFDALSSAQGDLMHLAMIVATARDIKHGVGATEVDLEELHDLASEALVSLWITSNSLREVSQELTGESARQSAVRHVRTLERVWSIVRNPEHRPHDDKFALNNAREAFTGTDD